MVVPNCHVIRLITDGSGPVRRVVAIETSAGPVPVPEEAVVVVALGTIESARIALGSLPGLPGVGRIGANLMAHLRSNLTIRIPRDAVAGLNPAVKELQASALFVKGRHTHADGKFGHFHLQITAAGLAQPSGDSEAELFKKVPDLDTIDTMRQATDTTIVLTLRGIGEMRPDNCGFPSGRSRPAPGGRAVPRDHEPAGSGSSAVEVRELVGQVQPQERRTGFPRPEVTDADAGWSASGRFTGRCRVDTQPTEMLRRARTIEDPFAFLHSPQKVRRSQTTRPAWA